MDIKVKYRVYEFRVKKGYSCRELAERSGVSKSMINLIEDDKSNPSVRTICKLAAALKVSPYDLFYCIKK
jgi:transcriptional regulator with XRE-family HTH domain